MGPRRKKKSGGTPTPRPIPVRSAEDQILLQKASGAKHAIELLIAREANLRKTFNMVMSRVGEEDMLPGPISWKVWLLRDGLVTISYEDWEPRGRMEFVIAQSNLGEWRTTIPTPKGDIQTNSVPFGIGLRFHGCKFEFKNIGARVNNLTMLSYLYEDSRLLDPEQQAIIDFRLTVLGRVLDLSSSTTPSGAVPPDAHDTKQIALERFESLVCAFEGLLGAAQREEEVQAFLKANPILLGHVAAVIPKQKLGEDFVTDFILVNALPQGPQYTLVEIEAPSRKLFTKSGDLSRDLIHATGQILDWRAWLEQDKSHLRGKLPDFESPRFLIVIGRDSTMTVENKKRLRALNHGTPDQTIQTYDDILAMNRQFLQSFRQFLEGSPRPENHRENRLLPQVPGPETTPGT